ncbi:MAG: TrkH family potassium uptake protein [Nitrospinota bacterium]|nr:TrkH family potassium uptake protein [Nitrospinota bacterium]
MEQSLSTTSSSQHDQGPFSSPILWTTAGWIWISLAGFLALPLAVATISPGHSLPNHLSEAVSIAVTMAMAFVFGLAAVLLSRSRLAGARISASGGAIIAAFCWITVGFFASLPYYFSGWISGFVNCYFETISGFTTTGASVVPDPSIMPSSILLWRGMTQWLGGMGIIVLFVAVLPAIGESSHNLFQSEIPGGANFKKVTPRIQSTARGLWMIYLALTMTQAMLLWATGLPLFSAVFHAFTTLSTGGFSTYADSYATTPNAAAAWITIIFMILAGANFTLHFRVARGEGLRVYPLSAEFKAYLGLLLVASLLLTADLLARGAGPGPGVFQALTHGFFQATSIMTTTGYMSADFGQWSYFAQSILLSLMFIGGCSGSTSGAVKVIRHLLAFKAIQGELKRMANPKRITTMRLDREVINENMPANALVFIVLFMGIFVICALALALMGMDIISAFSASASCLGNVGPGLGSVGPATTYLGVPTGAKVVLILEMLMGRLELFGLILFVMVMTSRKQ